jgi:hypothetical protein
MLAHAQDECKFVLTFLALIVIRWHCTLLNYAIVYEYFMYNFNRYDSFVKALGGPYSLILCTNRAGD